MSRVPVLVPNRGRRESQELEHEGARVSRVHDRRTRLHVEPSEPEAGQCDVAPDPPGSRRGAARAEPGPPGRAARGARAVRRLLPAPRAGCPRDPTLDGDPRHGAGDRHARAVHRGAGREGRHARARGLRLRRLAHDCVLRRPACRRPDRPGQPARALPRAQARPPCVQDRRADAQGLPARRAEPARQPRRVRGPDDDGHRRRGVAPRRIDGAARRRGAARSAGRRRDPHSPPAQLRSARVSRRSVSRSRASSASPRRCRGCASTSRSRWRSTPWPTWLT